LKASLDFIISDMKTGKVSYCSMSPNLSIYVNKVEKYQRERVVEFAKNLDLQTKSGRCFTRIMGRKNVERRRKTREKTTDSK
jgi:hypothetical protein